MLRCITLFLFVAFVWSSIDTKHQSDHLRLSHKQINHTNYPCDPHISQMIILPPEHMNGLTPPSFFRPDWLQSVWECSQTYLSSHTLPLNSLCQSESEWLCNPAFFVSSSRPCEVAGRWGVGGVRRWLTLSRIKAEGRHPAMIIWEAWHHRWLCLFSGQIRGKARRQAGDHSLMLVFQWKVGTDAAWRRLCVVTPNQWMYWT